MLSSFLVKIMRKNLQNKIGDIKEKFMVKKLMFVLSLLLTLFTIVACKSDDKPTKTTTPNEERMTISLLGINGSGTKSNPYELLLNKGENHEISVGLTPEGTEVEFEYVKKTDDSFVKLGASETSGIEFTWITDNQKFTLEALKTGTSYLRLYKEDVEVFLKVSIIEISEEENLSMWIASSYENIFPENVKNEASHETSNMQMAKNEYESFQVLLRGRVRFTITDVVFSDLVNGDKKITNDNLKYNFVEYVNLPFRSPGMNDDSIVGKAPGYFPDALSNEATLEVEGNKTQSIWITVYSPKDTEPGIYNGKATIETTQGDIEVNISIDVKDVTIPDSNEAEYSIFFWQLILGAGFGQSYADDHSSDILVQKFGYERWTPEWWAIVDEIAEVMKENRANQLFVQTVQLLLDGGTTLEGDTYHFNWSKFDEYVQYFIDNGVAKGLLGYMMVSLDNVNLIKLDAEGVPMTGTVKFGTKEADNWFDQYIPALYNHLIEKGWLDMWTQNVRDEPMNANDLANYTLLLNRVREAAPDMRVGDPHVNANAYNYMLENVDALFPLINIADGNQSLFEQKYGKHIEDQDFYTYTSVVPQGHHLNRFIDKPVFSGRTIAWFNYNIGATGYLHWGLMAWYRPITDFANGDTASIFPDIENQTIKSSIRMAALRDGSEDFELLKIIEKTSESAAKQLANVLGKDANLGYSRDINEMIETRALLLKLAEGDFGDYIFVEDIEVEEDELDITLGTGMRVEHKVLPLDANDRSVTWESSNPSVVKVDNTGMLYALSSGTATITITSNDNKNLVKEVIVTVPEDKTQFVIGPTADASLGNGANVDRNYGSSVFLAVASNDTTGRRTIIKYDITGVNSASKASIWLYIYQIDADPAQTLKFYKTSSDWQESSVTWNNAPEVDDLIGEFTFTNDTGENDTQGYWFELDITDFIDYQENDISILIVNEGPVSDAGGIYFAPKERTVAEHRNRLVLEGVETVHYETINLDQTELSLEFNQYGKLEATAIPEANFDQIVWKSSDESIATVDQYGNIHALKNGTVTITAYSEANPSVKADATVTISGIENVIAVEVSDDVVISHENPSLNNGAGETLWTVYEHPRFRTVLKFGLPVIDEPIESVVLRVYLKGMTTTEANMLIQLYYPNEEISWSESSVTWANAPRTDNRIANYQVSADSKNNSWVDIVLDKTQLDRFSVDGQLSLTMVANSTGKFEFLSKETGNPAKLIINKELPITGIELEEDEVVLNTTDNTTATLSVVVTPEKYHESIVFTSSDEAVATIDQNGKITVVGVGTSTITISNKDGSITKTVNVIVEE